MSMNGASGWKLIIKDLAATVKRQMTNWRMFRKESSDLMKADQALDAKIEAHTKTGDDLVDYIRTRMEVK